MLKRIGLAALVATVLSAAAPKVIVVDIDGVIHPITVAILTHALDQAASQEPDPANAGVREAITCMTLRGVV